MAHKVISEGPFWSVEREGDDEFVNFPGSFAEYVISQADPTYCATCRGECHCAAGSAQ